MEFKHPNQEAGETQDARWYIEKFVLTVLNNTNHFERFMGKVRNHIALCLSMGYSFEVMP